MAHFWGSKLMRLLHIAPRFPPFLDGIGDYASRLAQELHLRFGAQNLFLSGDVNQQPGAELSVLESRSSDVLLRTLQSLQFDRVLLHYCGYGFQKRGAPLWLLRGLTRFLQMQDVPLIVSFHELWASGKPWQSPFYFGP